MQKKENKREWTKHISRHSPKSLISDFKALSWYQRAGQYYAIFTSHAPSFGDVVAHWHGLCVPLHRQNLHRNLRARSKINLRIDIGSMPWSRKSVILGSDARCVLFVLFLLFWFFLHTWNLDKFFWLCGKKFSSAAPILELKEQCK